MFFGKILYSTAIYNQCGHAAFNRDCSYKQKTASWSTNDIGNRQVSEQATKQRTNTQQAQSLKNDQHDDKHVCIYNQFIYNCSQFLNKSN